MVIALVTVGGLLVVAARPVAEVLEAVLPGRAKVRGLGTNYDGFEVIAPTILRRTGYVMISVATVVLLTATIIPRLPQWLVPRSASVGHDRVIRLVSQGAIAALTAIWYGWLAEPHNAYRSNARFHWVDYLTFDSDNYFYAAGRLPHLVFYDTPYLWQAVNVALVVVLVAWIANRIGLSTSTSLAMCATPAIASNLLLFADTSEDVMLNIALLIALIAASLTRRPVLVGLALSAAVLGRPSFLVLVVCVPGAEMLVAWNRNRPGSWSERFRQFDWRYVALSTTAMVVSTAGFQLLFSLLGRRYMLTRDRIVDTGPLDGIEPTNVDGFEIWPLSGAYALHLLWVMPLVFLVGAAFNGALAGRYERTETATAYFCIIAIVAILGVHELKPLGYYNIRYLTYLWPFLFVSSWMAFARLVQRRSTPVRAGLATALVLGAAVLPVHPVQSKRSLEQREGTELLAIREAVDDLVGDGPLQVTFGDRFTENLLAYVIRDSRSKIEIVAPGDLTTESTVITLRSGALAGRNPIYETDSFLIYAPVGADDSGDAE